MKNTKIAMGFALKATKKEWEKNGGGGNDKLKELETAERKGSNRKVRGRKKTMEN